MNGWPFAMPAGPIAKADAASMKRFNAAAFVSAASSLHVTTRARVAGFGNRNSLVRSRSSLPMMTAPSIEACTAAISDVNTYSTASCL